MKPTCTIACLATTISISLLTACASGQGGYARTSPNAAELAARVETAERAPDERGAWLSLIRQMQQQDAWFASLAHIEAYRQQHGTSAELRLMHADALRQTGQIEAAEPIYSALTGQTAQAAAAWHGLGLIAAEQGQPQRSIQALERAVQLAPLNIHYLGDLGYARMRDGQHAAARNPLTQAAELEPGNVKAVANLALWLLLANEPGRADALMQRAALPDATRQEIYRLAVDLRVSTAHDRTTPTVVRSAPVTAAAARPTSAAAGGDGGSPPLRSMLERFNASPAPSSEKLP